VLGLAQRFLEQLRLRCDGRRIKLGRRDHEWNVGLDAVARREQHDVVVEGAARRALAATDHATAVDEHQHRPARGAALGDENIHYVARSPPYFTSRKTLTPVYGSCSCNGA